jgi:benzoyl-CoA reductase/2-hydroxyglutaryl-CoA dehydratase subunit BcrC/BadD/HgdB
MAVEVMEQLEAAVADPGAYAKQWTEKTGRRALGVFPNYFPVEIIDAAGFLPVGLWGTQIPSDKADSHLQTFICSLVKTNFEMALTGKLDALSGAVFPEICDSVQNSENVWRSVKPEDFTTRYRLSKNPDSPAAKGFLTAECKRVAAEITSHFGPPIQDLDLHEAIMRRNNLRYKVRDLMGRFYGGSLDITPRQFFTAIKASHIIETEEWIDLANGLLASPPAFEFGGTRVLIVGMTPEPWWILDELERVQTSVVGDDVAFCSRAYDTAVEQEGEAFEALANYSLNLNPCANLHFANKDRGDHLLAKVALVKAQGVIFTRLKFCDPEAYDHPNLKKRLDEANIPSLLIESDMFSEDKGAVSTRIEAFVEQMEGSAR